MEYVLAHARYPSALFAFVEGKDDSGFYLPELRRWWRHGDVIPLVCDGKSGVLSALGRVSAGKRENSRALFFYDKDLDDFLGLQLPKDSRLFVTSGYSVENYLVTETSFKAVWTDLFRLSISDPRFDVELERFNVGLRRFHRMCKPLMAWILFHRQANIRLNLSDIRLAQLVNVSELLLPCWRNRKSMAMILGMCNNGHALRPVCLRRSIRLFSGCAPKQYVRGKYELWFFVKCLQRCMERLAKDAPGARPSCAINFTEANAIEVLSGRGIIHPDLEKFLVQVSGAP